VTDHEKRLREVYKELIDKVITQNVATLMYQRGALTFPELESIQRCATQSEAAKILVSILMSQQGDMYECFLSALKQTNQEDVYLWLAYKGKLALMMSRGITYVV